MESSSSQDSFVRTWLEDIPPAFIVGGEAGATKPGEAEEETGKDVEMEEAVGEAGPEVVVEETPRAEEENPAMEEIAEPAPVVTTTAEQSAENAEGAMVAEGPDERAPSVVQNTEPAVERPEDTESAAAQVVQPKTEESPEVVVGPGIPAEPGMVWMQVPTADVEIKVEERPRRILATFPTVGPGARDDPIVLDDDEMEVDPPAAEKK